MLPYIRDVNCSDFREKNPISSVRFSCAKYAVLEVNLVCVFFLTRSSGFVSLLFNCYLSFPGDYSLMV